MKTKQEVFEFEHGIEDELKRINDSYQRCLIKKDKVSLDKDPDKEYKGCLEDEKLLGRRADD